MSQNVISPGAPQNAVGIFDSGVGGLSILREVVRQLPSCNILYLADSGHVPYGERDAREIQTFSQAITAFLVRHGACVVVVACNTASAAALSFLRARFAVPIVGMEPAVKPAAEQSNSQHIGVIATQATFQGQLFARLVERFARDTQIHTQVCPGLVEQVEAGLLEHPDTTAMLRQYLLPLLESGIDSLVLGCTHYPFLRTTIEQIIGSNIVIIDPAPAVARQTGRVLAQSGRQCEEGTGQVTYFTSGDPATFQSMVRCLVGIPGPVRAIAWKGNEIILQQPVAKTC